MSVIVAKSTTCCITQPPPVVHDCFPGIAVRQIVPANSSITVDSILVSQYRGTKWNVLISTDDQTRSRAYEILATHRAGLNPTFNMYAIIGDFIDHAPSVTSSSGTFNLMITNNESVDLIVDITRLAIPITSDVIVSGDFIEIGNLNTVVRSNTTSSLDFIDQQTYVACKWLCTITTESSNVEMFTVFALLTPIPTYIMYGFSGNANITYEIIVNAVGSLGVELALNNLSTENFRVDITRIPTQIDNFTPSCGYSNGLSIWLPQQSTINPTDVVGVDTIDINSHAAVKWLVSVINTGTMETMTFETLALLHPTPVLETVYSIVGDYFDLEPTLTINVNQATLEFTNNQLFPIRVNLLRIPIVL